MIFMNQTLEAISDDYFAENNYSAVENFLMVLNAYNQLRRKKRQQDYLNHIMIIANILVNHYLTL